MSPAVSVVVVTRDRRRSALGTVERLERLPERPRVIVVDNASSDGTAEAIESLHGGVEVVHLPANLGAAGRNSGAALSATPYVAFSDDDSWWAPGALAAAAAVLDAHPRLGLVAARVLVGVDQRLDPTCAEMEASPLRSGGGPWPAVLGFVACGAVVRRRAFLEVGGFRLGYGIGGEEELLAIDLAAAGWALSYCPHVVAHHHPATERGPGEDRRRRQARNALRTAWLRRRPRGALRRTLQLARPALRDPAVRVGLADAARDLAWIWPARVPVGAGLDADLRLLDRAHR